MPRRAVFLCSLVLFGAGHAFARAMPHARTLERAKAQRAYHGAPPTIPHAVDAETANAPGRCLACHRVTVEVAPMNAYSPTTPHPELAACTQCHVPAGTGKPFRPSRFAGLKPPPLTGGALPTSPPPMPHGLAMRENCAACHSGAAAPLAIFKKHEERGPCVQCHVSKESEAAFRRGGEAPP